MYLLYAKPWLSGYIVSVLSRDIFATADFRNVNGKNTKKSRKSEKKKGPTDGNKLSEAQRIKDNQMNSVD